MTTTDLTDMIDSLDTGWTEEVEWAELLALHDDACHDRQLAATVGQLRHYECQCPMYFQARREMRHRLPLILELTESKFTVPVTAKPEGGNSAKLHPPAPGNLVNADETLRMLDVAAETICRDWSLNSISLLTARLGDIRMETGARLATERDDAAAVLRPAWQAARRHLGYDQRPIRLACDCGARMGLQGREIVCDGCGRHQEVHTGLAAAMVAHVQRRRCRRMHEPSWTVNAQGNQVCTECTELLRRRREARKTADKARDQAIQARTVAPRAET